MRGMNLPPAPPPPPPASKAASAPAKPAAKGGFGRFLRRWIFRLLMLGALLGGGFYYANQQPALQPYTQKIADAILPPQFAPPTEESSPTPQEDSADSKNDFAAADSDSDSADFESPLPDNIAADSKTESKSEEMFLESPDSETERKIATLQEAVARLQLDGAAFNESVRRLDGARAESLDSADLQLQLIDLRLRQSGDTAAAVRDLLPLRNAAGIDQQWLAAEIARLQNAPSKNTVAEALHSLVVAADSSFSGPDFQSDFAAADSEFQADAADSSALSRLQSSLFSLLKIRRVHSAAAAPAQAMRRLEVLFLSGRRLAYLRELESLESLSSGSAGVAREIGALRQYGAPEYFLNLDSRQ